MSEEKVSRVTRLVVGRGKTHRPSEAEEWVRDYYEIEAVIEDPADLEVMRANMLGQIEGWLSSQSVVAPPPPPTPTPPAATAIPNVDLHDLEHDLAWRSWQKDEKGACSYPAKEGHSAWIRISQAGNTVLTLVKAMKRQNMKEINLGLFAYKLSGEDFLQRSPLKEPEPEVDATAQVESKFPKDLARLLMFDVEGDFIVMKPQEYLGSENFAKIASIVRGEDGEYISAGRESHFRIKK